MQAIKDRNEQFFAALHVKDGPGRVGGDAGVMAAESGADMEGTGAGQAAQDAILQELESQAADA